MRLINIHPKKDNRLRISARHHAAESREASLPLSDQWVGSQIQQAAVILVFQWQWHRVPEFAE